MNQRNETNTQNRLDENPNKILVFVYGTLMKGEANHNAFLKNAVFIGEGDVSGFGLYNLGYFPGVVHREKGSTAVFGEVYAVDKETLRQLDRLEGEGSLYKRELTKVRTWKDGELECFIYVYLGSVDERKRYVDEKNCYVRWKQHPERGELSLKKESHVFYVCYGSNMLSARFMCYLKGGKYLEFNHDIRACEDTSEPLMSMPFPLPYDMYYAKSSTSWKGGAVSFLDTTKPGRAYGVAYLITNEQFEHICCQENGGTPPKDAFWYNEVFKLGEWDGIPVYTLTHKGKFANGIPCEEYRDVVFEGIREHYPYLTREEINEYVEKCMNIDNYRG